MLRYELILHMVFVLFDVLCAGWCFFVCFIISLSCLCFVVLPWLCSWLYCYFLCYALLFSSLWFVILLLFCVWGLFYLCLLHYVLIWLAVCYIGFCSFVGFLLLFSAALYSNFEMLCSFCCCSVYSFTLSAFLVLLNNKSGHFFFLVIVIELFLFCVFCCDVFL